MCRNDYARLVQWGQLAAIITVALAAIALTISTLLAAAGAMPWVGFPLSLGGDPLPNAGRTVQIGLTLALLVLAVFLPSSTRVMQLEAAHRDFRISMEDVIRAYQVVHADDRAAAFRMTSEFDRVRERYDALRGHPDLDGINAELLTVAAQMSTQSRDLAEAFSDARVERARASLTERLREAEELQSRIQHAYATTLEVKRQLDEVEFEEGSVQAQLNRLREELADLGPLGLIDPAPEGGKPARGHLRPVATK